MRRRQQRARASRHNVDLLELEFAVCFDDWGNDNYNSWHLIKLSVLSFSICSIGADIETASKSSSDTNIVNNNRNTETAMTR